MAVNNESPAKLLADMQRYFSRLTSVRIWIGVKYWSAGQKFWIGWAVRRNSGVDGSLRTQFSWPPNHHDVNTPSNVVYRIPMAEVFGPHIPTPPGLPATLDIDTEEIRMKILDNN